MRLANLLDARTAWALAAFAIALFIFVQSSRASITIQDWPLSLVFRDSESGQGQSLDELGHGLAHVGMFAALAFCLHRALGKLSLKAAGVAAALATLYGVSDEWHQSMVAVREAALGDVGLDVVGAVLGSFCSLLVARSGPGPS